MLRRVRCAREPKCLRLQQQTTLTAASSRSRQCQLHWKVLGVHDRSFSRMGCTRAGRTPKIHSQRQWHARPVQTERKDHGRSLKKRAQCSIVIVMCYGSMMETSKALGGDLGIHASRRHGDGEAHVICTTNHNQYMELMNQLYTTRGRAT